jgi:hypothetical protein
MTEKTNGGSSFLFLERVTALALLLVLLALGWMVGMAFQPDWMRFTSTDAEVLAVLGLLLGTLLLVSLVALLHRHEGAPGT